jgi:selenide,water dikinase
VLTKPLGFGTTTTALKRGQAAVEDVAEVVSWMKCLNKGASELALEFGVRGGTDITGFSLLGHALEVAQASGVGLRLDFERIPFVSSAHRYAAEFIFPGGAYDNRLYFGPEVTFASKIDEPSQLLLFDPQTSGGLLLSVPADKLEALLGRAIEMSQPAWVIGEVVDGEGIEVY